MEAVRQAFPVTLACLWTLAVLASGQQTKIPVGAILGATDGPAERSLNQALNEPGNEEEGAVKLDLQLEHLEDKDSYLVSQAVTRLLDQKGIAALVVPSLTPVVAWWANRYNLPVVSLKSTSVPSGTPDAAVEISPNPQLALVEVMRFYKWSSLHYFYQDDEGLNRLQSLQEIGSGALNLSSWFLYRVEDSHTGRSILRKLDVTKTSNRIFVALDLDPDLVAEVLSEVSKLAYLDKTSFHFLLFQPVDNNLWWEPFMKGMFVSGIRLYDPKTIPQGITTDTHMNVYGATTQWLLARDASRLLLEASSRLSRNDPAVLQDILSSSNGSARGDQPLPHGALVSKYIRETFVNDGHTPGSLQFSSNGKRKAFTLDIMESTSDEPVKAFSWSDATGLHVIAPNYVQRDTVLSSRTYIVTSILDRPYLQLKENANKLEGNDRYYGYVIDLMDMLAQDLGMKYEIKVVKDGRYGSINPNTFKFDGMIGEIINHEADMAVADLTITSKREEVVDFSIPFMNVGITLMVKRPGDTGDPPSTAYFFLSPFAPEVWGCLFVALVVVGVAHFAIGQLLSKAGSSQQSVTRSSSLLDSLWFAFGSLFLRQTGLQPKSFSNRVLTGVWWVFAFFVLALYLTSLVSILVSNEMGVSGLGREHELARKTAPEIIKESVETGYPKIGLISSGSTEAFFRSSHNPLYLSLYESIKANPDVRMRNQRAGHDKVVTDNGDFAFLMESSSNQYISSHECKTIMIPQLLDSKGYGIAFAKGSPLRQLFNMGILKMTELGKLQQLYTKWWVASSPCKQDQITKKTKDLYNSSMTLSDVAGVFFLLVAGALLTLLVALAEILFSRRIGHVMQRVALTNVSSKSESDQLNGEGFHGTNDRSSL